MFDFNRLAEALMGGAARPPGRTRRRRAASPFGSSRSNEARAVRVLASLAGLAVEAMTKSAEPAPPPRKADGTPPPGKPAASPWGNPPPAPPAPRAEQAEALLLIRAMVATAAADGAVDRAERQAIAGQLDAAGLTPSERDLVLADLEAPATPEALAAEVTDPMQAAQLYAAAVAIAAEMSAAERGFLDRLRAALMLSPTAAAAIEARLA
ncbi:DUF533 domain-containing protein [Humitalea sp. 24SJ18S-53]|uniref:DUF533 domain-containing protein n=1 Tax=Humitalea sp. 24SJ18S-53 TaxID=3422307 RepID=UPI003D67DA08